MAYPPPVTESGTSTSERSNFAACVMTSKGHSGPSKRPSCPSVSRFDSSPGDEPVTTRWQRLGYAAAAGAGIGSLAFWTVYWFTFVRGDLKGPDFFSFYAAAKLYVLKGGSAVYSLALQRQFELQVTGQPAAQFVVLPYYHPPYYTLLIAPLAFLDYRGAYYAMAAFNLVLVAALIVILVRTSLKVHGRAVVVAAAMIAGFFPLFITILQGQSDLVVLVPLAAAYAAWARGRPGWAGAFSALALAKPQLLLLIPILFIARRAWHALAAFAGVILGLGLVSVATFGPDAVGKYLGAVGAWASPASCRRVDSSSSPTRRPTRC